MFANGARHRAEYVPGYLPISLAVLGAGLLVLWRLYCVQLGPDPDTDAYGHYVIARQFLETPENLKIHWVWLPLYHVLVALGVAMGASLDHVRAVNASLAALPPLVLLWASQPHKSATPDAIDRALPYLAACVAAASPIANQVGTSGQMEVLFSLLLVGAAALLGRGRHGLAAVVLSAAVLMRYEAWAVVLAVASVLAARRWLRGTHLDVGAVACVLAPGACVLLWAGLRWWGGEPWFGFIRENQRFAEGVLQSRTADAHWEFVALSRYVLIVPYRVLGLALPFAALGLARTYRKHGIWFVALPLAVVCFLTVSSLTRSQLGLDRHFLSVLPFAALWVAHGVARVAEWLALAQARLRGSPRGGPLLAAAHDLKALDIRAWSFGIISLSLCLGVVVRCVDWMGDWQDVTRAALGDARRAGRFLQTTAPGSLIVCDEAAVEVLSGLPSSRFLRARVGAGFIPTLLQLATTRDVFVVSRAERMHELAGLGSLRYGAPGAPAESLLAVQVPVHASSARARPVRGE
jgi:hypothetical protein